MPFFVSFDGAAPKRRVFSSDQQTHPSARSSSGLAPAFSPPPSRGKDLDGKDLDGKYDSQLRKRKEERERKTALTHHVGSGGGGRRGAGAAGRRRGGSSDRRALLLGEGAGNQSDHEEHKGKELHFVMECVGKEGVRRGSGRSRRRRANRQWRFLERFRLCH